MTFYRWWELLTILGLVKNIANICQRPFYCGIFCSLNCSVSLICQSLEYGLTLDQSFFWEKRVFFIFKPLAELPLNFYRTRKKVLLCRAIRSLGDYVLWYATKECSVNVNVFAVFLDDNLFWVLCTRPTESFWLLGLASAVSKRLLDFLASSRYP